MNLIVAIRELPYDFTAELGPVIPPLQRADLSPAEKNQAMKTWLDRAHDGAVATAENLVNIAERIGHDDPEYKAELLDDARQYLSVAEQIRDSRKVA